MPQSRKRPGHHEFRKPSDIPATQRAKGRVLLSVLFSVFAIIVAYFAVGGDYLILAIAALAGAVIGYLVGKSMEQDAKKND